MHLAVMYHYVREPNEWKGSVPISPAAFEKQIDKLGKSFEFVLPDDLRKKTSKPKCVLTFDDATKDQYEIAFDIMKRKGVPGYFSVMSGPLKYREVPVFHLVHAALSHFEEDTLWDGIKELLSPDDIPKIDFANKIYAYEPSQVRRYIKYSLNFILKNKKSKAFLESIVYAEYGSKQGFIDRMYINIEEFREMDRAGMVLGVHCVHHKPYDGSGEKYFKEEIEDCAVFMQKHLQIKPQWYTPPFGGGEKHSQMIADLQNLLAPNYKGAFTTQDGWIDDPAEYWLKRVDCNSPIIS